MKWINSRGDLGNKEWVVVPETTLLIFYTKKEGI